MACRFNAGISSLRQLRSDTADKLQALFRQTPPDKKVANEIIRYKQAKGRLPTSLS
jgi:hypothetical protein